MVEPSLTSISAQIKALDQIVAHRTVVQKKILAEKRKKITEFPSPDVVGYSQFLHFSNQFAIPVQNWKEGTPFYRVRGPKKGKANIHSAATQRARHYPMGQEEIDYVLSTRYATTELEMPLHCGVFEVVPTHKEPVVFSHKCIWKEYM
jgi:hypothetical protein